MFSDLVMASPVAFGMIYVLIFSATKQVGALLFSLAFWTASRLVVKDLVSKSLLISAIGMAMLFGSIDITALQYRLYPPFRISNNGIHAARFIHVIDWDIYISNWSI